VIDWRTRRGFPAVAALGRRPGGRRTGQSREDRATGTEERG
jgi:hypothetical protein